MSLAKLLKPPFWLAYSQKLKNYILNPRCYGTFTIGDAQNSALRFVSLQSGCKDEGNEVYFYWLVDESDGILVDVKFQAYGDSILIGLCEAITQLIVGKNYDQAARIHIEVIDHALRDSHQKSAFPDEALSHITLILQALKVGAQKCMDIPISHNYVAPPIDTSPMEGEGYPGFENLSLSQKIALINQVLDEEVRPYIEMDAGGVEVIGLQNNHLTIAYQGTCTSCYSATGATLSFIQKVIRAKVDPQLEVIPNL